MPLTQLAPPYPIFTDRDGSPLDNGYLYFGAADQNPETNPITVYFDNALTQPAAQPIRTINGYPSRNGSAAAIYTNEYFSVTVRNKKNELVIYAPSGYGITPGTSASFTDQITYNEGSNDAVDRTLTNRLQEKVSVKDFGAVGDGVTDDGAVFDTMATEIGYINVPRGTFSLNTRNIDVPIYFETGGMITIPAGQTVTIRNRITASPKQQIFAGDGQLFLENDNALGIGEDSKHAYAAWWGIFAVGQTNTIQTALFNKALSAFTSQTREGVFELDCGSFRIDGTVTIPRGVWFKGISTRRTIIDLVGDGYTAIRSGGAAIKISGIQFEQPSGDEAYFDGIQFELLHSAPVVEDVRVYNPRIGIFLGVDAVGASVKQVQGVYGREPIGGYPAGSATIQVQCQHASIENVRVTNTSFGPESALLLGNGGTVAVINIHISDIRCTEKTIPVKLVADTQNVFNVSINSALFLGDTGNNIDAVVDISSSGTFDVNNVVINNAIANALAGSLLKVAQGSSGITQGISLASGAASSTLTTAANLNRTAGTLTRVTIGSAVEARRAPVPVVVSGNASQIEVPNPLLPVLIMANDAVAQLAPYNRGGLFGVMNMGNGGAFPNLTSSGQVLYDVGATPAISKISGGANFDVLAPNTIPTGTTGNVNELNVSAVDTGILYFENRTGGTISLRLSAE